MLLLLWVVVMLMFVMFSELLVVCVMIRLGWLMIRFDRVGDSCSSDIYDSVVVVCGIDSVILLLWLWIVRFVSLMFGCMLD